MSKKPIAKVETTALVKKQYGLMAEAKRREAESIKAKLQGLVVHDPSTYQVAFEVRARAKSYLDEVEAERKEITDPIRKSVNLIMDLYRPARQIAEAVIAETNQMIIAYDDHQEKERARLQLIANKERDKERGKLQKRINALRNKGKDEEADQLERELEIMHNPLIETGPTTPGLSMVDLYRCQVNDLMRLVRAVVAGSVPLAALQANESWLDKQAAHLKDEFDYPGCELVKTKSPRSNRRS